MKSKSVILSFLLCGTLGFSGCSRIPAEVIPEAMEPFTETEEQTTENNHEETETVPETEESMEIIPEAVEEILEETTDPDDSLETAPIVVEEIIYQPADQPVGISADDMSGNYLTAFPEDFIFPITDGSTSTTNLDNAVRNAVIGGEQKIAHSKTYIAFDNLLNGSCSLIFSTPLSEQQLEAMKSRNFRHEAEPVAGEGFVFVVNKDNPVDTLTIEQIKGIYSGEITNWKEVDGNDAEIIAYQRNDASGSQNYMISFMGDTPLMKPVTDHIPASMSGILDVIANYDNGMDAIGYSVYAYSDGIYENISEIKYIRVNGVEPSLQTLADGSYPLLGYNYAVFSADEPEDSDVRTLVKWMQSEEGQQVIANAGYVPYRPIAGMTLPEPTVKKLYMAESTSGISHPEEPADYYYQCNTVPDTFPTAGLNEAVQAFISEAAEELLQIDEDTVRAYVSNRAPYGFGLDFHTNKTLINGYLSIVVGWRYDLGYQDSPYYYYDARTAVFDIYTGERLELSDLFFDDVYFVPLLNDHLAAEAVTPYSGFGTTHDMLRDFSGLYEGEFTFTADSIIFKPGSCFADGAELSLEGLSDYMVTSIPRDMTGYIDPETPVYKKLRMYHFGRISDPEVKNDITIWYLNAEKAQLSKEVCDKVNTFISDLYETFFTEEKLAAAAMEQGLHPDSISVGPYPDFDPSLHGKRYIDFGGANVAFVHKNDTETADFPVVEGHYNPYYFGYFFNAMTGEFLRVGDLFTEGWESTAKYYLADENFKMWEKDLETEYSGIIDENTCRILAISDYDSAPYNQGELSDLEIPVTILVETENGDWVAIFVEREYIR